MKISPPQMRKIYAYARQVGLSNYLLHSFLKNQIGKEHISHLTKYEARRFINSLLINFDVPPGGRRAETIDIQDQVTGCSIKQCNRIRVLMEDAGWTEGMLKDYLERFGAQRPEELTRTLAKKCIEYLESEIRRNMVPAARGHRRGVQ